MTNDELVEMLLKHHDWKLERLVYNMLNNGCDDHKKKRCEVCVASFLKDLTKVCHNAGYEDAIRKLTTLGDDR